jgi:hypothetical protein
VADAVCHTHFRHLEYGQETLVQPVTHYNTSLWRSTTAHGKHIPRMRFQRSCALCTNSLGEVASSV